MNEDYFKATGLYKIHLHQADKPCVIGSISSQTYGNMWCWFPYLTQGHKWARSLSQMRPTCSLVPTKETITT